MSSHVLVYRRRETTEKTFSQTRLIPAFLQETITQVSCGENYFLALNQQREVFSWGTSNFYGQLGRITNKAQPKSLLQPTIIEELRNENIVQISAGKFHAAALSADGRVFMWGQGCFGKTGMQNSSNTSTPKLVTLLDGVKITQVCCGENHTCMLEEGGHVLVLGWGTNSHRVAVSKVSVAEASERVKQAVQLHTHIMKNMTLSAEGGQKSQVYPFVVHELSNEKVVKVVCGGPATVALTEDGKAYTFGHTTAKALGRPDAYNPSDRFIPRPLAIIKHKKIVDASVGTAHVLLLDSEGIAYSFGAHNEAQLARIAPESRQGIALAVNLPGKEKLVGVVASRNNSAFITVTGKVIIRGRLGEINNLFSKPVTQLSLSDNIIIGLSSPTYTVPTDIPKALEFKQLHDLSLTFQTSTGANKVMCNRCIIRTRCKTISSPQLAEPNIDIQLSNCNISNDAVVAFIKFIYSDTVQKEVTQSVKEELATLASQFGFARLSALVADESIQQKIPAGSLSNDLLLLLQTQEDADITFMLHEDVTIRAHKCILASRSEYFRACLQLEDGSTAEMQLDPEVSPDAFKVMLSFIYSGNPVGLNAQNACEVAILSNKYGLETLQLLSEQVIEDSVAVGSPLIDDLNEIAETYNLASLKNHLENITA